MPLTTVSANTGDTSRPTVQWAGRTYEEVQFSSYSVTKTVPNKTLKSSKSNLTLACAAIGAYAIYQLTPENYLSSVALVNRINPAAISAFFKSGLFLGVFNLIQHYTGTATRGVTVIKDIVSFSPVTREHQNFYQKIYDEVLPNFVKSKAKELFKQYTSNETAKANRSGKAKNNDYLSNSNEKKVANEYFQAVKQSCFNDLKNDHFFKSSSFKKLAGKRLLRDPSIYKNIQFLFSHYFAENKALIIKNFTLLKQQEQKSFLAICQEGNKTQENHEPMFLTSVPNDGKEAISLSQKEATEFFMLLNSLVNSNQCLSAKERAERREKASALVEHKMKLFLRSYSFNGKFIDATVNAINASSDTTLRKEFPFKKIEKIATARLEIAPIEKNNQLRSLAQGISKQLNLKNTSDKFLLDRIHLYLLSKYHPATN